MKVSARLNLLFSCQVAIFIFNLQVQSLSNVRSSFLALLACAKVTEEADLQQITLRQISSSRALTEGKNNTTMTPSFPSPLSTHTHFLVRFNHIKGANKTL